jgi:hypothetical protein
MPWLAQPSEHWYAGIALRARQRDGLELAAWI